MLEKGHSVCVRWRVLLVVALTLLMTGCTAGLMDLALGGSVDRVEFAFPGRSTQSVRRVTLENVSGPGESQVLWCIAADREGLRLPIPTTIGETPAGFHTVVELAPNALADAAATDAPLMLSSSVGTTHSFRLSEMSATGRVVEIGHTHFVTSSTDVSAYVTLYRADHAKEDRGHRRYAAFLVVVAVVALTWLSARLNRRERSRLSVEAARITYPPPPPPPPSGEAGAQ